MWKWLPALLIGLSRLSAHPAVQLVVDSGGAVYYSDTTRVWRIAPDGTKTVAVPDVHTHELWMDRDGSLYGEHLTYHDPPLAAGVIWTHRVWKRSPDGRITDLIPTRKGFLSDYKDFSFHRDGRGAMYWCNSDGLIERRDRAGAPIKAVAKIPAQRVGWMSVLEDGTIIVVDHGSLIRVGPDGGFATLASRVSSGQDQHSIMGAWADRSGAIHVADSDSGAVKKIASRSDGRGAVTTVAVSPAPWRPVGGLARADGSLWILEVSPSNRQQVRSVSPSGKSRVY